MNKKISVIVPIYNGEKFLKRCVDSIINQTYSDLEIVLVDDGSTDSSGQICDEYAQLDSRIIVIHKENGGLSDARNKALDIISGEYVAFVDCDDYIAFDMYEKMFKRLCKDKSDMVFCNYYRLDEKDVSDCESYRLTPFINVSDQVLTRDEAFDFYIEHGGDYVAAWNKLYKRDIFEQLRYPDLTYEDAAVIQEVLNKCRKISHVSEPLYYYVMHYSSILHRKFGVQNLDFGEVLIRQYYFSKEIENLKFRKFCCSRLSYRFEEWKPLVQGDQILKQRYKRLKHRALFLIFEKGSWDAYSIKGKIVARVRFLLS